MDAFDLHTKIDYVGSSGIVLTPEQRASLQISLTILKHEMKFVTVVFWGIIRGTKSDYFIAQGIGKDELLDRTTVYSKDCINWGLLPVPSMEDKAKSYFLKGRFTGDPSHETQHVEIKQVPGEGDEIIETEEMIIMKEEDRLAAVIARINDDVSIIPRGSYLRLSSGQVVRNRSFEGKPIISCMVKGLTISESSRDGSYFHFRHPIHYPHKPLGDRAHMDKAIDFLDTIEEDVPKGN